MAELEIKTKTGQEISLSFSGQCEASFCFPTSLIFKIVLKPRSKETQVNASLNGANASFRKLPQVNLRSRLNGAEKWFI
jgi:hypothetical protein